MSPIYFCDIQHPDALLHTTCTSAQLQTEQDQSTRAEGRRLTTFYSHPSFNIASNRQSPRMAANINFWYKNKLLYYKRLVANSCKLILLHFVTFFYLLPSFKVLTRLRKVVWSSVLVACVTWIDDSEENKRKNKFSPHQEIMGKQKKQPYRNLILGDLLKKAWPTHIEELTRKKYIKLYIVYARHDVTFRYTRTHSPSREAIWTLLVLYYINSWCRNVVCIRFYKSLNTRRWRNVKQAIVWLLFMGVCVRESAVLIRLREKPQSWGKQEMMDTSPHIVIKEKNRTEEEK